MNTNPIYAIWCIHTVLEMLPLSSSGHIKLLQNILQYLGTPILKIDKYIEYLMHIPIAIILSFFILKNIFWQNMGANNIALLNLIKLAIAVFIADCFTGLFYLVFKKINISKFPLWLGFLITSILLLSLHFFGYFKKTNLNILEIPNLIQASIIGIAQGIALLPGISRLAITFVAACFMGLPISFAFIFSFMIQLPLIFAAIIRALFYYQTHEKPYVFKLNFSNLIGLVALICCSYLSYKLLELIFELAKKEQIHVFGFYMILPTLLAVYLRKQNKVSENIHK